MPETKSAHLYPGLEERMMQILEQENYVDQTIIQSFESDSLESLHRINPQAKLCALYGLWQFDVSAPAGDAEFVCAMAEMVLLDPGIIRRAHQQGRPVFVWFGAVENPLVMNIMSFFGADGLIMDSPLALMQ